MIYTNPSSNTYIGNDWTGGGKYDPSLTPLFLSLYIPTPLYAVPLILSSHIIPSHYPLITMTDLIQHHLYVQHNYFYVFNTIISVMFNTTSSVYLTPLLLRYVVYPDIPMALPLHQMLSHSVLRGWRVIYLSLGRQSVLKSTPCQVVSTHTPPLSTHITLYQQHPINNTLPYHMPCPLTLLPKPNPLNLVLPLPLTLILLPTPYPFPCTSPGMACRGHCCYPFPLY